MSNTCGCSFSNEEIRNLLLLEENILTERGIEMIATLPKKELSTIIKIAALLPSPSEMKTILIKNEKELSLGITKPFENLHNAVEAIRIALSQTVRGGTYRHMDTIEALSIVIDKHSAEGRKYWENELMKALLKDEQLKQIGTWSNHYGGIRELIQFFNLPEEKVKEILKELIDKRNKELVRVSNLFIEASISSKEELKKEAKDIFRKLIFSDEEMFLLYHLTVAEKMDVLISSEEHQAIADNLLVAANASTDAWTRRNMVRIAYYAYKNLCEHDLKNRERIIERYNNTKNDNGEINKAIKTASEVIGFKYEKQGFWDIHIGR